MPVALAHSTSAALARMHMLGLYLTALGATVAMQAAPGPNLLAVAGVALSEGRLRGVLVAAGVASGVLIWATAFAFGMAALFERHPVAGQAMQLAGGSYFVWIGVRALRAARRGDVGAIEAGARTMSPGGAWRRGLLVVLTNPKAALMWAAITALLSGGGLAPLGVLAFAPIGSLSAFLIYGGYAVLFSTGVARRVHARSARTLEATFGALFTLLGAKLLLDGLRELRATA